MKIREKELESHMKSLRQKKDAPQTYKHEKMSNHENGAPLPLQAVKEVR